MDAGDEGSHQGRAIGGASATLAPLVTPGYFRFIRHESGNRLFLVASVVLIAATAVLIGGGWWIVGRTEGAVRVGGMVLVVLGAAVGLAAAAVSGLTISIWHMNADHFRNGMLMPGVIVEEEPTALAVLADMGNGSGPDYWGVYRLKPDRPPARGRVGDWVPCVAIYKRAESGDADRWAWFSPVPLYYGVGDAVVDRMRDRLGAEPVRRLEACVRRGVVPAG